MMQVQVGEARTVYHEEDVCRSLRLETGPAVFGIFEEDLRRLKKIEKL